MEKLGTLEDIEEELGVDLIKLLNAKKVYVLDYGKPYETWSPSINFKTRKLYNFYGEHGGGEKKLIENIDEEYCSCFEPKKEK